MTVRVHQAAGEEDLPLAHLPDSLSLEDIRMAVETALRQNEAPLLAVDVILVDDPTLAELHGQFLDDPTPTDVMAFDLRDEHSDDPAPQEGEREVEGEIYVSLDRARWMMGEGASAERTPTEVPASTRDLASEVLLYAVHGALHLCGFDDHEEDERRAMRRAEIAVFRELGRQLKEDVHLDA